MLDEIFAPLYTTEWGRRLGWAALIVMILLLVGISILGIYYWRKDYLLTHSVAQPVHSPTQISQSVQLVTELPGFHLFGHSTVGDRLPITSLQLHLVGVIKSVPEQFSRVIISEGGKSGKIYQVGDTLTGGVKINAITNDGVILENEGRFENLPLQRAPLQFQGMPKPLLPNRISQEE